MREGKFREDLYYRLNVFHLHLPPLRERREDIGHLAAYFLGQFAMELGKTSLSLGPDVCAVLEQYDWPGNVRELQNIMERAAVLSQGSVVDRAFFRLLLPARAEPAADPASDTLRLDPAVEEVERKVILRAPGCCERQQGGSRPPARHQ